LSIQIILLIEDFFMNNVGKALLIAMGAASLVVAPSAFATNGYFTHGNGTKNKGMAGAGIAMPEEAMAISNNPASALLVGDRFDAGAALFSPRRSYSSSASQAQGNMGAFTIGPNNLESAREYFVIPHLAYTKQLSDISAWGIAFYGRGGMNTKWEGGNATFDPDGQGTQFPVVTLPGTFGAGTAGVDLSQALLDVSYARKLSDNFNVGISAVVAIQAFEAYGVNNFAGFTESFVNNFFQTGMPDPSVVTNLTNNGHEYSTGIGAKIGFQTALSPAVSLAGAYQTEIGMSELDTYADLLKKAALIFPPI
jgi:long-chain fatty acid transport protein